MASPPAVSFIGNHLPLSLAHRSVLPLPLSHDFSHGNHEFIHILAGVVKGEGGTDAHLVAEGTEGGLSAVVTGTHRDALLI